MITLRRHELLWVLEQCGARDWPYPLTAVAWPADTEDETVLARSRTEDALAARGLLEPAPAASLLAVGTAVRDARWQVDLVRRGSGPTAAVALAGPGGAALLSSADHAGADVRVRPVGPAEIVPAVLALLPRLPPAPGPALEVPPPAAALETRRRERQRWGVDALLESAVAWTQLGVAVTPNGVNWADDRADARIKWLDSPRGRYRLRHDRGQAGPPRLVPDDAASPGTRAEVEALLPEPGEEHDMSGPGPASDRGFAALDPADAERFAGKVDDLERTVAEAREALRRLAEDPLATGTGQENAEMAAWYRELLVTDTVPAADDLARQLDAVRRAVVEGTAAWRESERSIRDSLDPDPDPGQG